MIQAYLIFHPVWQHWQKIWWFSHSIFWSLPSSLLLQQARDQITETAGSGQGSGISFGSLSHRWLWVVDDPNYSKEGTSYWLIFR